MAEVDTVNKPETATDPPVAAGAEPPEFQVRLTEDKVQVLLDCPDPHSDLHGVVSRIVDEFKKLELPQYPDEDFLTTVLHNICPPGEHVIDAILIMGQPPVPPQHGRLEWSRDYFADGWETDVETGAINYWAKIDNQSVAAGEKLLVMTPAVPGEAGMNVFGAKIAVDKPEKVRVRCGKGVSETEAENGVCVYCSEIDGRIKFSDNTLTVDDVYIIKGNLDLDAGNITHTGTLQIEGDVETGASIEAGGDIVIKGMLEPANVCAGGNVTVGGGIVGSPEHIINAGGEVRAKYIKEATIRAGGDVIVVHEIDHCDLETRGKVDASRGRIAGGRTIARQGITVGKAGAKGAAKTLLAAGIDPTLDAQVSAMKADLKQKERARIKLRQTVQNALDGGTPKTPAEETLLSEMDAKARQLAQEVADGEMAIRKLINGAMAEAREDIFILQECWAGTTVQLGEFKNLVKVSIMKPRLVKRFKTRVRVVPMGDNNAPDTAD